MGAWNTSITGNDTAQDLISEYQAAFYYYDVNTALEKIDYYVRTEGLSEDDQEEWCNYYYSLADFMHKKGILTETVKEKILQMIDSGFGLELWAESGTKILNKRKKALEDFRNKICSPQPSKKKIRIDLYLTPYLLERSDIISSWETKTRYNFGFVIEINKINKMIDELDKYFLILSKKLSF